MLSQRAKELLQMISLVFNTQGAKYCNLSFSVYSKPLDPQKHNHSSKFLYFWWNLLSTFCPTTCILSTTSYCPNYIKMVS